MTELEFIKCLSDKIKSGQETVTFIVKGKWSERGYKKLFGVKGEQVAEYDDGVLCAFPANELLRAAIRINEYYHNGRTTGKQLTDEEYYEALEELTRGYYIRKVVIDP